MKLKTIASLAVSVAVIVGGVSYFATHYDDSPNPAVPDNSTIASTADASGKSGIQQVIEITAKGGYTPRTARARAGAPLLLKIKTDGTFDCSAALRIASLGWSQNLGPSEEVSVQIPAQKPGATLVGVCAMGMYNFKITFE